MTIFTFLHLESVEHLASNLLLSEQHFIIISCVSSVMYSTYSKIYVGVEFKIGIKVWVLLYLFLLHLYTVCAPAMRLKVVFHSTELSLLQTFSPI